MPPIVSFYHDSVLDSLLSYAGNRAPDDHARRELESEVVGCCVLTMYNKRIWRISEIDWDKSIDDTFAQENTQISFRDYFKNRYNVILESNIKCMLVSRPKRNQKGPRSVLSAT
eukprot:TRINITY_DN2229_c1_g1_i1.p1 TRINITY_DN2229_c1_g1~~TRINITY_DN2229_c1_g1_i1.p1  ORF type:complete len:114 (+),score=11.35 TRINITY_DN2229_c1_g1_i1:101-442(+)